MACGSCATRAPEYKYEVTDKNGLVKVYGSEIEAKAAVARNGGSYRTVK